METKNIELCQVCNHAKWVDKECNHIHYLISQKKRSFKYISKKEERNCVVCHNFYMGNGTNPYCSEECKWFVYRNRPKDDIPTSNDVSVA